MGQLHLKVTKTFNSTYLQVSLSFPPKLNQLLLLTSQVLWMAISLSWSPVVKNPLFGHQVSSIPFSKHLSHSFHPFPSHCHYQSSICQPRTGQLQHAKAICPVLGKEHASGTKSKKTQFKPRKVDNQGRGDTLRIMYMKKATTGDMCKVLRGREVESGKS